MTPAGNAFSISQVCEDAVIVHFRYQRIPAPELVRAIAACRRQLIAELPGLIDDCVASYASLLIYYAFTRIPVEDFIEKITASINTALCAAEERPPATTAVEVPTYYSAETGPDLARLAALKEIDVHRLIQLHSQTPYTVYAIGFAPGFAYMGFVDALLAAPRLDKPRKAVTRGSVGIADRQTGIYPSDSPGGWNIIGRTPLDIFTAAAGGRDNCLLKVGDSVIFKPIDRGEFIRLGGKLS